MGGHNFQSAKYGIEDMDEAYRAACEDATYDYGHDDYNGTVSTTVGVERSPLVSDWTPEDQIDYEAVTDRSLELDKGGICEAIPILEVTPEKSVFVGSVLVEMNVPAESLANRADMDARALKAALKAVKEDPARLQNPSKEHLVAEAARGDLWASVQSVLNLSTRTQVQTVAPKEKTETRYFVVTGSNRSLPNWGDGHKTQAEARAALPSAVTGYMSDRVGHSETWEVIAMTRRASGEALVKHRLEVVGAGKTAKVRVQVNLMKTLEKGKATGRKGWLFYGFAAS